MSRKTARRVLAAFFAALAAMATLGLVACSAILGIDDVQYATLEAGITGDGARREDARGDGAIEASAPPVTDRGVPDATPTGDAADSCPTRSPTNTAGLSSCEARVDGKYCGRNDQLNPKTGVYPQKEDVVFCSAGAISMTRPCTRCLLMPGGEPDECDPCPCRPDGYYCGHDFSDWTQTSYANAQIKCTDGAAAMPVKRCTTCTTGSQTPCP